MIEVGEQTDTEITEQSFYEIVVQGIGLYHEMAKEQDRNLVVKVLDWKMPYFSAWARYEKETNLYTVNFWGGFARINGTTERGFALTVCHEIGHILAQAPFHKIEDSKMMSAEGQSDYFAASQCFKKYHHNYPFSRETELDPFAASKCESQFKEDEEQKDLCFQTAKAGKDLSVVLAFIGQSDLPRYDTPQQLVVPETLYNSYPDIQCRLDTYLQGALSGYDTKLNKVVTSEEMRPKCWFNNEKTTYDAGQIDD